MIERFEMEGTPVNVTTEVYPNNPLVSVFTIGLFGSLVNVPSVGVTDIVTFPSNPRDNVSDNVTPRIFSTLVPPITTAWNIDAGGGILPNEYVTLAALSITKSVEPKFTVMRGITGGPTTRPL